MIWNDRLMNSLHLQFGFMRALLKNRFTCRKILSFPQLPHKNSMLYKFGKILGCVFTSDPNSRCDLIIRWEDTTFGDSYDQLDRYQRERNIINYRCRDISKEKIEFIHQKVMGYGTFINPTIFSEKCVKKSNLNAKHDGKVVECPIAEVEEGYVYQKIINNQIDIDMVEDIRLPIIRCPMPFCYLKTRCISKRFTNQNSAVRLCDTCDILSSEEQSKILEFCDGIGMQYGELDIVRDRDSGQIFIIDANNTPYGPPNHLSPEAGRYAVKQLAAAFESAFM